MANMWRVLGIGAVVMMAGFAVLGAVLAIAFLLADIPVIALNAVIIPLSIIPALGFLAWVKSKHRSPMVKAQNIVAGIWVVAFATISAHVVSLFPGGATTAVVSTTGIEIVLWLVFFQVTRKVYRDGRRKNIASASGKALDDPEVINLASNHDLATATVAAMLFTTKSIILMESSFADFLTPAAARVIGITLGSSLGLILFNLCPNQTNIREFITRHRNLEH